MNRPNPRRGRRAVGRVRRVPRPTPLGPARLLESARMTADPDIRLELVARVRQEIRAGTYDTPEKLEAALDRMAACLDLT
jgi:Anti-sigma-28 factor, FlgM